MAEPFVPLITGGPIERPRSYLEESPLPYGEAIQAEAGLAFGQNVGTRLYESIIGPGARPLFGEDAREMVPADIAKRNAQERGVKLDIPPEGLAADRLEFLIRRAEDTRWRTSMAERGSQSFIGDTGLFFVDLAMGAMDPLQLAAAFTPAEWVGVSAKLASRITTGATVAERAGARFAVGAAQGLGGAVALEPFNYMAAQTLQDDYTATDSLVSLVLGSLLGGGLHSVIGLGSEAAARFKGPRDTYAQAQPTSPLGQEIAAQPTEVKIALVKTALAQTLDGRPVEIEPVLHAARQNPAMAAQTESAMRVQVLNELTPEFKKELQAELAAIPGGKEVVNLKPAEWQAKLDEAVAGRKTAVETERARIRSESRLSAEGAQTKAEFTVDERIAKIRSAVDAAKSIQKVAKDVTALDRGIIPARFVERVKEAMSARKQVSLSNTRPLAEAAAVNVKQHDAYDPTVAKEVARRSQEIPGEEVKAIEDANQKLREAIADLNDTAKAVGIENIEDALAVHDEAVKETRRMKGLLKLLGECTLRNG